MTQTAVQTVEPDISTLPKKMTVWDGDPGFYLASVDRSNGKMKLVKHFGKRHPKEKPGIPLLNSPEEALVYCHYDSERKEISWQIMKVGAE